MTQKNSQNSLSHLWDLTPEDSRNELMKKMCRALDCTERVFYNKRKGITKITKLEEKIIKKYSK